MCKHFIALFTPFQIYPIMTKYKDLGKEYYFMTWLARSLLQILLFKAMWAFCPNCSFPFPPQKQQVRQCHAAGRTQPPSNMTQATFEEGSTWRPANLRGIKSYRFCEIPKLQAEEIKTGQTDICGTTEIKSVAHHHFKND